MPVSVSVLGTLSASHTEYSRFQRTSVSQIPKVLTEIFLTRDVGDMKMIISLDVAIRKTHGYRKKWSYLCILGLGLRAEGFSGQFLS